MRIAYIADDGTEFDDLEECENYEYFHGKCKINNVVFFDEKGNEMRFSDYQGRYDAVDNIYQRAEKVIIENEEDLKSLLEISDGYGWCEFEDFDSVGTWKRYEHSPYDVKWLKEE